MPIPESLASGLHAIFPAGAFAQDDATRAAYAYDNSRRSALPDAVVFPTTHEQVVALVQACRKHHTPLIARGRGTNTTGATVPDAGGVVASFERMDRIVDIAPADRLAIVEPGVLNADLQRALSEHGLFWPPDRQSTRLNSRPPSIPYPVVGL